MVKKLFLLSVIFGLLCSVSTVVYGAEAVETANLPQNQNQKGTSWKAAGQEIGEAAHAVGDATADSSKHIWNETKKESAEAWGAAKKGSTEAWEAAKKQGKAAWEEGKASIHDATAPPPAASETD